MVLILLARTLIHNPKVLFMDEIFKGLSSDEQALLKDYIKSLPMTRILVSHHSLSDAGCDEIIEMRQGQFLQREALTRILLVFLDY